MEFPKENIVLLLHLKNGKRTKGFFYMNGRKPTFASYGTEITDMVIGWEYVQNEPRAAAKPPINENAYKEKEK
jgi:hypothetical protein